MKNSSLIFLSIISSLCFYSCSSSNDEARKKEILEEMADKPATKEELLLIGKWKLSIQQNKAVPSEKIDYSKQKIEIITRFESNGYFETYDTFLDPKYINSGLPKIQLRGKGQWKMSEGFLTLQHLDTENKRTEKLKVDILNEKTLEVHGAEKNTSIYKTYSSL
jgi:hypothetical protein